MPSDINYEFILSSQQQHRQHFHSQFHHHYGNLLLPKSIKYKNVEQLYLKRSNTIPFRDPNLILNNKAIALMNKCRKTIKNTTQNLYNNTINTTPLISTSLLSSANMPLSNKVLNVNNNCKLEINNNNNNQKFIFDIKLFSSALVDNSNVNNRFNNSVTRTAYLNEKKLNNNNVKTTTRIKTLTSPTLTTKISNNNVNNNLSFNNSFGQHLVNFFPFIDSLSCSEERLTSSNYCSKEKKMPYLYSDFPFFNSDLQYPQTYNSVLTPIISVSEFI